MNQLQQLINQMCPNGVEWKTLGEVCEMKRGTSLTKANSVEGEYPVISGGKEPAFYCNQYNRDGETITIAGSGAGAGFVQYWNQKIFVNDAFSMKGNDNLSTRYLYYCLQNLQEQIYATKKGGGVPHVHISDVQGFPIPLPPLAIQSRIVEILDHFTNLTANLTAELALRRKQFEHFREKLLSLDGVPKMKVSQFCELKAGKAISASELNDDNEFWCFGGNGTRGKVSFFSHNGDYAIIGRQGALCGCVSWATGKFYATEHAVVVSPKENANSRFLFHLFTFANLNQYKSQGAQPGLSVSNLNELSFSIPPLAVQQSIVAKLDKFTALIQNIENELALRQKQYEYYREQLLSFPQPARNS